MSDESRNNCTDPNLNDHLQPKVEETNENEKLEELHVGVGVPVHPEPPVLSGQPASEPSSSGTNTAKKGAVSTLEGASSEQSRAGAATNLVTMERAVLEKVSAQGGSANPKNGGTTTNLVTMERAVLDKVSAQSGSQPGGSSSGPSSGGTDTKLPSKERAVGAKGVVSDKAGTASDVDTLVVDVLRDIQPLPTTNGPTEVPGAHAVLSALYTDPTNGTHELAVMMHTGSPDNETGLAQALPVGEVQERESIPDAVPFDELRQGRFRQKQTCQQRIWFAGGILLLCAAVAIAVSLSIRSSPDSTGSLAPSEAPFPISPTMAPTSAPWSLIDNRLLPNATLLAIAEPLSPQNKAYEWLALHPDISNMTQWSRVQLFALATFFYNFHGEDWVDVVGSDWLIYDKSECDWYSRVFIHLFWSFKEGKYSIKERNTNETTCNELGEFTRLSLSMPGTPSTTSQVRTPMPPEIALLTALEEIEMNFIAVNGPLTDFFIPEMKNLHKLRRIHLTGNNLTGSIPQSLCDVLPAQLEEFVLESRLLSGTLPSEFQLFSSLKKLHVSYGLNGTIPTALGKLTLLERLDLANRNMEGTIPSELYGLTHLTTLDLSPANAQGPNLLTGTLSTLLGQLTNLRILEIDARLSGTIPTSISYLVDLERLGLRNNLFSGSLPLLGDLGNLNFLDLHNNGLTGTMPSDIFTNQQLPKTLEHLDLSGNFLSGTLPDALWSLTNLRSIWLANNLGLAGELPAARIQSFSQLGSFKISGNSFYGTIPFSAFNNSSRLHQLDLDGNDFSGSISNEIGLLTDLSGINLSNNRLTGSIPAEIGHCTRLHYFRIQGNSITGSIPSQLGVSPFLRDLNLSENAGLVGRIPSELGLVRFLISLSLEGTGLTGSVPEEVCRLKTTGLGALDEIRVNCSAVACSCNCTCA